MDFVIGGLAGAGATIFTNPMDVVKIRLQLQGELRARSDYPTRYRGMFNALYVIAKTDGVMALQKGLIPAMVMGFCMNSVRLGTYHVAETQGWTKKDNSTQISVPKAMFWAAVAGGLSSLTANPASVLKTRIQSASHPSIAVGRQHKYKGLIDGCVTIYRTEGMRGFFSGISATAARLGIGGSAQLTTFSAAKEYLLSQGYFVNSPAALAFFASQMCSVVVILIDTPLDVVNTRLYNQGPASDGKLMYNGILDCFAKISRTEGIFGFYKGLGPLYLRIAPHTTLSLVIWDMLNILFKESRNK